MKKVFQIQAKFKSYETEIQLFIDNFDKQGETIYKGSRNELKTKSIKDISVNIKRFQIPNWVNQFAYRWIRSSKAKRSFIYAKTLLEKEVSTPEPIAYQENYSVLGILNSYYVSIHQDYDFTIRELIYQPGFPNRERILRDFTKFTYHFHDQGIFFIDHSPGNTLIKKRNEGYDFFLVDLNRMKFKTLTFHERIKNFAKLSPEKEMFIVIADKYARLLNRDSNEVFDHMWNEVKAFRKKVDKKEAARSKRFSKSKK